MVWDTPKQCLITVPPDCRCFFTSIWVSKSPKEWFSHERDKSGYATTDEGRSYTRLGQDESASPFIRHMRRIGKDTTATKAERGNYQVELEDMYDITIAYDAILCVSMSGEMKTHYPDAMHYTVHMSGRDALEQVQNVIHLHFCLCTDGAGEKHGHWQPLLDESWAKPGNTMFEGARRQYTILASREDYAVFFR